MRYIRRQEIEGEARERIQLLWSQNWSLDLRNFIEELTTYKERTMVEPIGDCDKLKMVSGIYLH